MFDLANITVDLDARPLELRHPQTGEVLKGKDGKAWTVLLHGHDSEQYKRHARKFLNERMNAGKKNLKVEQVEREAVEQLVGLTAGWKNIVLNGEELEYSTDKAREIYADPRYSWLRDQVESFASDRANFLPQSPES